MIEDFLHAVGAPGWLIITASTLLGLYHFRHVLGIAALVGSWLKMLGLAIALFVIASAGVIPGVEIDVSVQVGVLLDLGERLWEFGEVVYEVVL